MKSTKMNEIRIIDGILYQLDVETGELTELTMADFSDMFDKGNERRRVERENASARIPRYCYRAKIG